MEVGTGVLAGLHPVEGATVLASLHLLPLRFSFDQSASEAGSECLLAAGDHELLRR